MRLPNDAQKGFRNLMTMRRAALALLISLVITTVLVVAIAFLPLVSLLFGQAAHGPETGGISMVAGGVQTKAFLLIASIIFLIVFALLSRKRTAQ